VRIRASPNQLIEELVIASIDAGLANDHRSFGTPTAGRSEIA
jgi:hypothetical protein